MSDKLDHEVQQASGGTRAGAWLGAAVSAAGLGACVTVVNLGGWGIMGLGGFAASGGPYEIAHPIPEGYWIMIVAFIGIWVFPVAHGIFASRIKGFGLYYATWCTMWTSLGATSLLFGFLTPGGDGLAWGPLIMGGIFLLVGLGSTKLYLDYLRSPERERSGMSVNQRVPYAVMVAAALAGGVVAGFLTFSAVT